MKMRFSLCFIVLVLTGCGGGGEHKNPPTVPTLPASSSSSSVSSLAPSSSSSSTISSSSSTLLSSSSSISSSSAASISSQASSSIAFTLTSTSFVSGDYIPIKYSCFGSEINPQLAWNITSDSVKGFALVMEDIDAIAIPTVGHPYVHWNVFNIPASAREIPESATLRGVMPAGSIEGLNEDNVPKYAGPCPPPASGIHHYHFSLYALNRETLTINTGRTWQRGEFEQAFTAAIIAKTEIIGLYRP